MLAAGLLTSPAAAASATPGGYRTAVTRVLALVDQGDAGGAAAELQASGLAGSLPEVDSDLRLSPPDLEDAARRLRAALAALDQPADTADPARDRTEVKRILNLPRYAGNRPSPWDQFLAWVGARIIDWLNSIHLPLGGLAIPTWIWLVLVGAAVVAAAIGVALVARFCGSAGRGRAAGSGMEPARMVRERFQEADRLAAAGDWDGAVRALAEAVATRLSGEPWWASSPQTLRELFRQAGRQEALHPLLAAFEHVVYGRRRLNEAGYRAAGAAAAAIRAEPPAEAAA